MKQLRQRKDEVASGWASMLQCVSEAFSKATGLGEDLLSCKLIEGKNQFLMLKRREKGHVILVIDHNNGAVSYTHLTLPTNREV